MRNSTNKYGKRARRLSASTGKRPGTLRDQDKNPATDAAMSKPAAIITREYRRDPKLHGKAFKPAVSVSGRVSAMELLGRCEDSDVINPDPVPPRSRD